MSQRIGDYMFCSTYSILKDAVPVFLQNSFVLRDFHTHELLGLLSIPLSLEERSRINTFHQTKYNNHNGEIKPLHKEKLKSYFMNVQNKQQRNEAIKNAYNDGYSKSEIARNISLSVAGVSKILKS